jgi:hypothetical protein
MAVPKLPDPPPFHATPPLELDLHGFGAVVFTSGLRPDYGHWVRFSAFDAMGYPLTEDGASSVVPGLFFCGVHFLRKRKSAVLFSVGEDAAIVAQSIANNQSQLPAAVAEGPRPAMAAATAAYSTLSALAASRSRAPAAREVTPPDYPDASCVPKRTIHRA